ncbi:MAG: hypothetical protein GEU81_10530 [Nitriliruptorales bacterium]|nr:hypothetical protein [Nitriliruptorales bacterium]
MRILLDETAPQAITGVLRSLLPGHTVDHVEDLGWRGRTDHALLQAAGEAGYEVIVVAEGNQLRDPAACRAIERSGLHHVRFPHDAGRGLSGVGRAMASLIAAMPGMVAALERAGGQRLVRVRGVSQQGRFTVTDPAAGPPEDWPR